jgi:uncharacterized membrane protein
MHKAIRSNVTIAGHPVHPMLIPFPIAFLVGAFVTDLIFWGTFNGFWAQASVYLTVAGLVTGAVAAAVGFTDFVTLPQVREHRMAWIHFLGNAAVLLLALVRSLYSWTEPTETVVPVGIALSFSITVLLVITGWAGGELAYRHKIGVIEEE